LIVEGFDNAWHVLRYWLAQGYQCFVLEGTGARVARPRPCHADELPAAARAGLDYFPLPPLHSEIGDNPDPERTLTAAEILLATAIAEGWEPEIA
jgi:hypothetical protein